MEAVSRRELWSVAAAAFGLRAAVFAGAAVLDGISFAEYAAYRDGDHYMAYAEAWRSGVSALAPGVGRLFPGYPGLMAVLHAAGLPLSAAALLPSWLAAGAVAALAARVFRDVRIGWALAVLTPTALLNASLVSTEAWCVALALAAVLRLRSGRVLSAGLLLGLAALFRPVALFPAVATMFLVAGPRRRSGAGLLLGAGAVLAAGLLVVHWRFGDALMSPKAYTDHAYGGAILSLPFRSLILTPREQGTPLWKILYVWAHVALTLAGCALAWRRYRGAPAGGRPQAAFATAWLFLNTAFVLCIGSQWGFHEFHRFIIPALPPLFWAYGPWLPRRPAVWLALALPSLAMAVAGAARTAL